MSELVNHVEYPVSQDSVATRAAGEGPARGTAARWLFVRGVLTRRGQDSPHAVELVLAPEEMFGSGSLGRTGLSPQSEGMAAGISAISFSVMPRGDKFVTPITNVKGVTSNLPDPTEQPCLLRQASGMERKILQCGQLASASPVAKRARTSDTVRSPSSRAPHPAAGAPAGSRCRIIRRSVQCTRYPAATSRRYASA